MAAEVSNHALITRAVPSDLTKPLFCGGQFPWQHRNESWPLCSVPNVEVQFRLSILPGMLKKTATSFSGAHALFVGMKLRACWRLLNTRPGTISPVLALLAPNIYIQFSQMITVHTKFRLAVVAVETAISKHDRELAPHDDNA